MTTHIDAAPAVDTSCTQPAQEIKTLSTSESKPKPRRRNKNKNRNATPNIQSDQSVSRANDAPPVTDAPISNETMVITENMLSLIQQWNENHHTFWTIQTIYKTSTKLHIYLAKKILQHDILDNFEDARVNDAVMKGIKVPSQDEYWMHTYKIEIKQLQQTLNNPSTWISNTLPEHRNNVVWGTPPTPQAVHDKDSQVYFIKKNQTQKPPSKRKSVEGITKFG